MPEPLENPKEFLRSIVNANWSSWAKNVAASTAVLYALGLVISNEYLAGIWASDFSLIRARCVITGVWATITLVIGAFPVLLAFLLSRWPGGLVKKVTGCIIGFVVGWCTSSMVGLFLLSLFQPALTFDFPKGFSVPVAIPKEIAEITLIFFVVFVIAQLIAYKEVLPKSAIIAIILLASAGSTWTIAQKIYPTITPGLGGGRPEAVVLVLNKDGVDAWNNLCGRKASDSSALTGHVGLLYQNDKSLIVSIQETPPPEYAKVVELDRKLVAGIVYLDSSINSCQIQSKPPIQ